MENSINVYELLKLLYEEEHKYNKMEQDYDNLKQKISVIEKIKTLLLTRNVSLIMNEDFEKLISFIKKENSSNIVDMIRISLIITNSLRDNNLTDNNDYEKYDNKYNSYLFNLNTTLEELCVELKKIEVEILKKTRVNSIYRRITGRLSKDKYLFQEDSEFLLKLLMEKGYSRDDIILLFEEIRANNFERFNPAEEHYDIVSKIIKTNYDYEVIPYISNNESRAKIDSMGDAFYLACNGPINSFNTVLLNIPTFSDNLYSSEEIDYLYLSLINKYVEELKRVKNDLISSNNYENLEERKFLILDYNEVSEKYQRIKNRYYYLKSKYDSNHFLVENNEKTEENKKNLFYLMTSNKTESYIERDISRGNFSNQYLENVHDLLEQFKKGILSPKKYTVFSAAHGNFDGFGRIKDDQIRIFYYPLGNNNYLILGAGIKKDTRDNDLYQMSVNRYFSRGYNLSENSIEESAQVEQNLFSFIEENKTKGVR